jgi:iron complex outermembrane receptor protein
VALLYKINTLWSVFGSISNGFSSPTIQEFTNTIQFASNQRLLKAENGQNFELGSKISFAGGRAFLEATVYSLNLKNGLVRRLNENGNEFFDNSGLIIQNGLETSLKYALVIKNTSHFISAADLRLNYTYNDFRYKRFETANANFQNNKMPGVPQNNLFFTLDLQQKNGIFVNLDVNYLSSIPLNDANTFAADDAIMTNARAGFEKDLGKFPIKFFVGINNILNQEYSFGYDFNAFGNRFYNPAPLRNYNAGITIGLNSSK